VSGYTPAGNFAPTVEGPAGTDGVDGLPGATGATGATGPWPPPELAIACDVTPASLALDNAWIEPDLEAAAWTKSGGTDLDWGYDTCGWWDLTLTGTVGGNWLYAEANNLIGGPRTFEVVAEALADDWLLIEVYGTASAVHRVWYDVANNAIGTQSGAELVAAGCTIADFTYAGHVWRRCRLTIDGPIDSTRMRLAAVAADASLEGTTGAGASLRILGQAHVGHFPELNGPATRVVQRRIERVDSWGWLQRAGLEQLSDTLAAPFWFDPLRAEWGGEGPTEGESAGIYCGGYAEHTSRWLDLVGPGGAADLCRMLQDGAAIWAIFVDATIDADTLPVEPERWPLFALLDDLVAVAEEQALFATVHGVVGPAVMMRHTYALVEDPPQRALYWAARFGVSTAAGKIDAGGSPAAGSYSVLKPDAATEKTRCVVGGTPGGMGADLDARSGMPIHGVYVAIGRSLTRPRVEEIAWWLATRAGIWVPP
jgi:hypothetical protein